MVNDDIYQNDLFKWKMWPTMNIDHNNWIIFAFFFSSISLLKGAQPRGMYQK